jgi:DNA-binding CsgD family transcriptional regulator
MPPAVPRPSLTGRLAGRVVDRMRSATGAEVGFAALLDATGSRFSIGHLAGARTPRLAEIVSNPGVGVGGRCIELRKPVQVSDYVSARTITHEFDAAVRAEGLHAVFAVPFRIDGTVCGAVYGAARTPGWFGERALSAATGLADVHAPEEATVADYRDRGEVAYADLRAILGTVDDPALRRRLAAVSDRLCKRPRQSEPHIDLSPREIDVLASASLGRKNDEIAKELCLSVLTVKSYLKSAMAKLACHNRTEAVRLARRLGYLP